jgi:hypothetical protein
MKSLLLLTMSLLVTFVPMTPKMQLKMSGKFALLFLLILHVLSLSMLERLCYYSYLSYMS